MDRNSYFMEVAKLTAGQSKCKSRKVGAVVVMNKRIVGVGYNGPLASYPHCSPCRRHESKPGENLDSCPAVHAEANAIMEALKSCGREGISEATLYCTDRPCVNCIKMIISQGINRVIYINDYPTTPLRDWMVNHANLSEMQMGEHNC